MPNRTDQRAIALPEGTLYVSVQESYTDAPRLCVSTAPSDHASGHVRIRGKEYQFTVYPAFGEYKKPGDAPGAYVTAVGWQLAGTGNATTAHGNPVDYRSSTHTRIKDLAFRAADEYAKLVPDWRARSEIAAYADILRRGYQYQAREDFRSLEWWAERHDIEDKMYRAAGRLAADSEPPTYGLPFDANHYQRPYDYQPWVIYEPEHDRHWHRKVIHVPGCWALDEHQHHLRTMSGTLDGLQHSGEFNAVHGCIPDEAARIYLPDGTSRYRPLEYARHTFSVVVKIGDDWSVISWHLDPDSATHAHDRAVQGQTADRVLIARVIYS